MIPIETPGDVIDAMVSDRREMTALIGNVWSVKDPMIRRDLTDTAISELVRRGRGDVRLPRHAQVPQRR